MNTKQIIAKNTILQIFLQFFNLLVGFYSISLIARYLGKVAFGKYGFVSSFYFFFITFLDFGISVVVLREIAKERKNAGLFLSNLVTLKVLLSILLTFIAITIANIFPFSNELKFALSLYAAVLLFIALESIQIIFEADLKSEYIVLASFFWRAFALLFIILTIKLDLGLLFIIASFLLAEVVKCAVLYVSSKKFVNIKLPAIDLKLWTEMLKKAFPIGMTAILLTVIRNIDVMMLTKMKGFAEVGIYLASRRLCDMSLGLPIALIVSIFPLMSKFYKYDFNALKIIHQKSFDILSVCGILLALLVITFADKLVILLFGNEFIKSAVSLRILIFSTLFVYLTIGSGTLLTAVDKQILNMWFYVLGAQLNIVLNLILIPRFSFIGAAVANVIVIFLIMTLTFYFIAVKLKMRLEITKFKQAVISGLITLAVLFCLKDLSLFVSMTIGILLYLSLIIFLKAIDIDDIALLIKRKID